MRLLLESWGCRVSTRSGSRAIEMQQVMPPPDMVLADYHLDGETGLDVIGKLRAQRGSDFPAVLVTADRSTEVRAAAGEMGVPVLNKPVKPAALRSVMARARPLAAAE